LKLSLTVDPELSPPVGCQLVSYNRVRRRDLHSFRCYFVIALPLGDKGDHHIATGPLKVPETSLSRCNKEQKGGIVSF
jgi:hypothetical protein